MEAAMSNLRGTKHPTNRPSRAGTQTYADITACLEDFRAFILSAYGLVLLGNLKADDCFHGIRTEEDKRGSAPFRCCVHLDDPQNVFYIDLKRGFSGTWYPQDREPLDPAEREQRRREFEARRAERERETASRHAKAAARARELWARACPASGDHPYLKRKHVGAYGLRRLPEWRRRVYGKNGDYETVTVPDPLLIPMRDGVGEIWSLQAIFPETCPALGRDRDFLPGGRKTGLFHWIGPRTKTACLAEGYATAASIFEATAYRVFVAFDAGNLCNVAQTLRKAMPDARIVICADHDLPDKQGRRAGQEKARVAAALVGGYFALPPIAGADFNDFAAMLREGAHGR
jgi:putative DNA primase/helicase